MVENAAEGNLGAVQAQKEAYQAASNQAHMKDRRRELRNNATAAEASLWELLKGKQLHGRKFRRQHSFDNYVLDFYCPSEKLAIELDGADHFTEAGMAKDQERTTHLEQLGIRVLRFENDEVFKATEAVLHQITSAFEIQKEDIFHYTYGVLHCPAYRQKYEINLKRDFPRLPFYDDFWQWADWGKRLMDLHIGFEEVEPYPLKRLDAVWDKDRKPKAKLKPLRTDGIIVLDEQTEMKGVPPVAWDYKLGNRSALDWVLDQHKEKTPKDPTIREKFNTYRFADYKEKVVDLLKRVCTVSVETKGIIAEMEAAGFGGVEDAKEGGT